MDAIKTDLIASLAEFLLYGGLVAYLGVMHKKGAPWLKKLSVIATEVFAVLKALGALCVSVLYLAMEYGLFGLSSEKAAELLLIPSGVLGAITGVYLFAMLFLDFIFLGKVKE